MLELKVIQSGDSLAFQLPNNLKAKKGDTWILIPRKNGIGYLLVPKVKNPYKNVDTGKFYSEEEWSDFDFHEVN
jgi:hypothetical protein